MTERHVIITSAVLGVVVAILAWRFPQSAPSSPIAPPTATEAPQALQQPNEEPSPLTTPEAPSAAVKPSATTEPPTALLEMPADLSHIELELDRASNGAGHKIGPQFYALDDEGELQLDIGWTVYDTDGAERGDDCQLLVELHGPSASQARRFSDCQGGSRGFFRGWPETIVDTGVWTASVTDEVTGLSERVPFQVAGSRDQ